MHNEPNCLPVQQKTNQTAALESKNIWEKCQLTLEFHALSKVGVGIEIEYGIEAGAAVQHPRAKQLTEQFQLVASPTCGIVNFAFAHEFREFRFVSFRLQQRTFNWPN